MGRLSSSSEWWTSCVAEGLAKGATSVHAPTHPGLLRPVLLIAAGLALLAWGIFGLRPITPPQISPFEPALVETPVALEQSVLEDQGEPLEQGPVVLYPIAPTLGDRIGAITLPTLELSWPVFEGTEDEQLDAGVGHVFDSVLPGIRDNSVLSGHRTTVFGRLGELSIGDMIVVETLGGSFTYQVREFRIVKKTDRTVIVPTETAVLTLTTCYPFYSLIPTTEAFIVSADLVASDHTPRTFDPVSGAWRVAPRADD